MHLFTQNELTGFTHCLLVCQFGPISSHSEIRSQLIHETLRDRPGLAQSRRWEQPVKCGERESCLSLDVWFMATVGKSSTASVRRLSLSHEILPIFIKISQNCDKLTANLLHHRKFLGECQSSFLFGFAGLCPCSWY